MPFGVDRAIQLLRHTFNILSEDFIWLSRRDKFAYLHCTFTSNTNPKLIFYQSLWGHMFCLFSPFIAPIREIIHFCFYLSMTNINLLFIARKYQSYKIVWINKQTIEKKFVSFKFYLAVFIFVWSHFLGASQSTHLLAPTIIP